MAFIEARGDKGNFVAGKIVYMMFTTVASSTGIPASLVADVAGPAVSWLKDAGAVPAITGVTLSTDVGGVTGLNRVTVNTAGFVAGDYTLYVSDGKVGAQGVEGYVIGSFSIGEPQAVDLRFVNGGSTGPNAGKLELAQLKIAATGSDRGIDVTSVDEIAVSFISANNVGLNAESHGDEDGMFIGSTGGTGLAIETDGDNTAGVRIVYTANNSEVDLASKNWGIFIEGGNQGGVQIDGNFASTDSDGVQIIAYGVGDALKLTPGATGKGIACPVEMGADLIESLRLANAANGGKTSGMNTTHVQIRDISDTLNRVDATVDRFGNRSNVTLDLT